MGSFYIRVSFILQSQLSAFGLYSRSKIILPPLHDSEMTAFQVSFDPLAAWNFFPKVGKDINWTVIWFSHLNVMAWTRGFHKIENCTYILKVAEWANMEMTRCGLEAKQKYKRRL